MMDYYAHATARQLFWNAWRASIRRCSPVNTVALIVGTAQRCSANSSLQSRGGIAR
jgi:hypothetical protein